MHDWGGGGIGVPDNMETLRNMNTDPRYAHTKFVNCLCGEWASESCIRPIACHATILFVTTTQYRYAHYSLQKKK